MLLTRAVVVVATLSALPAFAERAITSEALSRMEESLTLRTEDGTLRKEDLVPVIVVSTQPAYAESAASYGSQAIAALARVFGAGALRSCEACMAPRVYAAEARLEYDTGPPGLEEIVRIDDLHRGSEPPAKSAVWLDETAEGVTLRIVALGTSRILYAENFDTHLREQARSAQNISRSEDLERRMRGESLVHTFVDAGLLPNQHFSIDWVEQFGGQNENLAGVSASAWDPLIGVGAAYYRVIPQAFGIAVGAKLLVSLPTALVTAVSQQNTTLVDPLLTGVAVVRVPIFSTNYGVLLTASTHGRFTVGVSLLNVSLLPVLP